MITLRDVAQEVGVSISAVSLVLNGHSQGRVRADLAERIRKTADEMLYVPNHFARSLSTKRTATVGLVSDQVATIPFAGHMLAGAQQVLWDEGYLLMLIDTAGNDEITGPAALSLIQRNVDALIFAVEHHKIIDLPTVPGGTPIVVLDGRPERSGRQVDFVVPDEESGARAAVRHLISHGHRRIAFCNVTGLYPEAARLRLEGYRSALEAAHITVEPDLTVAAESASTGAAIEPARRLLRRGDPPTAVFCFGDKLAMGFYHVARDLGLRIPDDLSIVGFDNQQFIADALSPGLTTVQLPHSEMGEWAARQVLKRIRGETLSCAPEGYLAPCTLVERNSVLRLIG
jgi:LacI family transcriptional regulator, galactose operon repressor